MEPVRVESQTENTEVETDLERLERTALEASEHAERLAREVALAKKREASEMRDRAVSLRNEAALLEGRAHELDPQEEAIKYVPEEPAVLKERRETTTSASKASKKRASKKAPRKAKKASKGKRGRPPGSKPQGPSQAEVVAAVAKHKNGVRVAELSQKHGWQSKIVSARLAAASRAEQVRNIGQGRDGVWEAV